MRCSLPIACSNRFNSLKDDDVTIKKHDCVEVPQGGLQSRSAYHREYGLRVGSWNFSGLCSQRKQKEVSEVLNKLKLDIVAVQESWERKGSVIEVQGYKWLDKPRKIQNSKRGEGGVGFLIRECLLAEVEFITNINLEERPGLKYVEVEVRNPCILDVFICPQLLLVFPRWMLVTKTLRKMSLFLRKKVR